MERRATIITWGRPANAARAEPQHASRRVLPIRAALPIRHCTRRLGVSPAEIKINHNQSVIISSISVEEDSGKGEAW